MKFIYTFAAVALVTPVEAVQATETVTYTYDAQGRMVKTVTAGTVNNGQTTDTLYDAAHNRTNYCVNQTCSPTPPPPPPPPPPTNLPPVANADSAGSMARCTFKTVDVTSNDTDPEGNYPLAVQSAGTTSGSVSATVASASSIQIESFDTPGAFSITYTVADSLGAVSAGTVSGSVTSAGNCNNLVAPPPPEGE